MDWPPAGYAGGRIPPAQATPMALVLRAPFFNVTTFDSPLRRCHVNPVQRSLKWMEPWPRPKSLPDRAWCGWALVGLLVAACGRSDVAGPAAAPLPTVSVGAGSACAVDTAGTARCWGANGFGQLGTGSTTGPQQCQGQPCSPVPVAVAGGLTFTAVSTGAQVACGLTTTGVTYCWGENVVGELGNGTSTGPEACGGGACSSVPVAISGQVTLKAVSVGSHFACGLTAAGGAFCWGSNNVGQLGVGTATGPQSCQGNQCSPQPVPVAGRLTFTAISAGGSVACSVTKAGGAYCWGFGGSGQLGDGTTTYSVAAPVAVAGQLVFNSVSAGDRSTCGITTSGGAYCWGENSVGELGDGTTTGQQCGGELCRTVPVAVAGGLVFTGVSVGNNFACGVTTTGAAYCWGANGVGQLGNGTTTPSAAPVAVAGGLTFAAVSAGNAAACGVTTAGATYCWGSGSLVPLRVLP